MVAAVASAAMGDCRDARCDAVGAAVGDGSGQAGGTRRRMRRRRCCSPVRGNAPQTHARSLSPSPPQAARAPSSQRFRSAISSGAHRMRHRVLVPFDRMAQRHAARRATARAGDRNHRVDAAVGHGRSASALARLRSAAVGAGQRQVARQADQPGQPLGVAQSRSSASSRSPARSRRARSAMAGDAARVLVRDQRLDQRLRARAGRPRPRAGRGRCRGCRTRPASRSRR